MRGGLDDALDKLARRDELRRRAAGEAGTPPAVTELVEAIAGVVARHPHLGVTVGAEGAGEPVLLHFSFAEGQVQVTAEPPPRTEAVTTTARHADFDIDLDDPVDDPYHAPGGETRRLSRDDQDRFGPATPYGYPEHAARDDGYHAESDTAERLYGSFDESPYPSHDPGETSRDLGARMRDLGMAARSAPPSSPAAPPPNPAPPPAAYPPHPFAATPPPPVPPQTSRPAEPSPSAQTTRRIHAEQHRAPAEPSAAERVAPQQRGMPAPLPEPIPLQVERPEETEMAARRLAALLRDDPSLLHQPPPA